MTTDDGKTVAAGWKTGFVTFVLLAVTLDVYLPVTRYGFVAYADPVYITANPAVRSGLSWSGLATAFGSTVGGFWQPLTTLSQMLDCQFLGLNPAAHHTANLALHVLNVLLLFGLLRRMTGSVWRSGFVAALFALHPLNVESVAWISERKNLLCAFFWLLASWAYVGFAARPSRWRYAATLLLALFSMMSKPVAVTLPFVLLLLDCWPLNRMTMASFGRLLLEKAPMVVLSAVFCVLTFQTQFAARAIVSGAAYSLIDRLSYAAVHYVLYIDKAIWPTGLAVLYPMWTTPVSLRSLVVCVVLLVFVTVVVLRRVGRFPYLTVGWLWYLVALLPTIGIILVGNHSMADRFVYIPLIGIFLMISWGAGDFVEEKPGRRRFAAVVAVAVLVALGWTSRAQVGFWRDSISLFRRAVEVTSGNYIMHENLGRELAASGEFDEAAAQFAQAVRINNVYLPARANLAMLLFSQGKQVEALALQSESVSLFPHDPQLLCDSGIMLADAGRKGEAAACLMQALWLNPELARAHFRLAVLLYEVGRVEEAYPHIEATIRLMPDSVEARNLESQIAAAMKKPK